MTKSVVGSRPYRAQVHAKEEEPENQVRGEPREPSLAPDALPFNLTHNFTTQRSLSLSLYSLSLFLNSSSMASLHDHNIVFNDDADDDDEDEPLNDVVLDEDDDSEDEPPPLPPPTTVFAMPAPTPLAATPVSERKPIDDSRRLFQRLWTDDDEIELLQGFLDYTTLRGPNSSHDTTAFYDQIKSKLQLDCNKNQLVEKLRRLKKKYRTVVSRITSAKDFLFKSPHDQATFDISRKIWSNSISNRPEFDDDDQNPNPSPIPPDHRTPTSFTIDVNTPNKMLMMMNITGTTPNTTSRKRSRAVKLDEKPPRNLNSGVYEPVNLTPIPPSQASVEETVKSCLSPLFKELLHNAAAATGIASSGVVGGATGIGSVASNAIPMNFPQTHSGNGAKIMEERWRKQQIIELEVYSKRLELVQDQIKLTLEELRVRGN